MYVLKNQTAPTILLNELMFLNIRINFKFKTQSTLLSNPLNVILKQKLPEME